MRMPSYLLGLPLAGVLTLTAGGGSLTAQDQNPGAKSAPGQEKTGEALQKPLQFQGVAKANAHTFEAKKDTTYRITVKAEGFTPLLQIADEFGPLSQMEGIDNEAKIIFTPQQSRKYKVMVEIANKGQIKTGAKSNYSLVIETAVFAGLTDVKRLLELNEKTYKLTAGRFYTISVQSRAFEPDVRLLAGDKVLKSVFNPGSPPKSSPNTEYVTALTFTPPKTADYRLLISVGPYSKPTEEALDYTVAVAEKKTELSISDQITRADAPYPNRLGSLSKVYKVKLEANKTYQIDMVSSAFDAYLFLEDATNKVLASDDDSGGDLNARIVYRPTKTETYRIIATTYRQRATGPFTLTVIENPNATIKPGAPAAPR